MENQKSILYILTDINRTHLQVGYCKNMQQLVDELEPTPHLYFDTINALSKLVYFEEYEQDSEAFQKFEELKYYTRAQKEKLIRSQNSNWTDLSKVKDNIESTIQLFNPWKSKAC